MHLHYKNDTMYIIKAFEKGDHNKNLCHEYITEYLMSGTLFMEVYLRDEYKMYSWLKFLTLERMTAH